MPFRACAAAQNMQTEGLFVTSYAGNIFLVGFVSHALKGMAHGFFGKKEELLLAVLEVIGQRGELIL